MSKLKFITSKKSNKKYKKIFPYELFLQLLFISLKKFKQNNIKRIFKYFLDAFFMT